ncbi:hypothetical protein BLNAU_903 [Blattamonas nauphoetae]|uniref:Uncharacterized protein n=1 Tax=Blattamonas nauphoetae TaxID=2049346 RepID=A0ABQ9YKU7_9EUKA|nr:hypothetical protein BLNAU_903 [Blattamonas nauphoetae]
MRTEIDTLTHHHSLQMDKMIENIQQQYATIQKDLQILDERIKRSTTTTQTQLRSFETDLKSISIRPSVDRETTTTLQRLSDTIDDVVRKISDCNSKIDKREAETDETSAQLTQLQHSLTVLQTKVNVFTDTLDGTITNYKKQLTKSIESQSNLASLEADMEDITKQTKRIQQQVDELESVERGRKDDLVKRLSTHRDEILRETTDSLATFKSTFLRDLEETKGERGRQAHQLNESLETQTLRLTQLQSTVSQLKDEQGTLSLSLNSLTQTVEELSHRDRESESAASIQMLHTTLMAVLQYLGLTVKQTDPSKHRSPKPSLTLTQINPAPWVKDLESIDKALFGSSQSQSTKNLLSPRLGRSSGLVGEVVKFQTMTEKLSEIVEKLRDEVAALPKEDTKEHTIDSDELRRMKEKAEKLEREMNEGLRRLEDRFEKESEEAQRRAKEAETVQKRKESEELTQKRQRRREKEVQREADLQKMADMAGKAQVSELSENVTQMKEKIGDLSEEMKTLGDTITLLRRAPPQRVPNTDPNADEPTDVAEPNPNKETSADVAGMIQEEVGILKLSLTRDIQKVKEDIRTELSKLKDETENTKHWGDQIEEIERKMGISTEKANRLEEQFEQLASKPNQVVQSPTSPDELNSLRTDITALREQMSKSEEDIERRINTTLADQLSQQEQTLLKSLAGLKKSEDNERASIVQSLTALDTRLTASIEQLSTQIKAEPAKDPKSSRVKHPTDDESDATVDEMNFTAPTLTTPQTIRSTRQDPHSLASDETIEQKIEASTLSFVTLLTNLAKNDTAVSIGDDDDNDDTNPFTSASARASNKSGPKPGGKGGKSGQDDAELSFASLTKRTERAIEKAASAIHNAISTGDTTLATNFQTIITQIQQGQQQFQQYMSELFGQLVREVQQQLGIVPPPEAAGGQTDTTSQTTSQGDKKGIDPTKKGKKK